MPYIKKTYKTGKVIEIEKKFTFHYNNRKTTRAPKRLVTSDIQEKINEYHAIKKLRRSINANFGCGDYHLILTYEKTKRPSSREEVLNIIQNFLKRARRLYAKAGKAFKYIFTTEYGERSVHHHLIINKIDSASLQAIWPFGRINVNPLDNSGQYEQLASYIIKQTRKTFCDPERQIHKKRWCPSRNLVIPVPKVEVIGAHDWKQDPQPLAGYVITKCRADVDEFTGYPYQCYTMVQIPSLFKGLESEVIHRKKNRKKVIHRRREQVIKREGELF